MSIALLEYSFSEPVLLAGWLPPATAGLYAVFAYDQQSGAWPFQLVDIGESDDLSAGGFPFRHPHYGSWVQTCTDIYLSTLWAPGSTPAQRRAAVARIQEAYLPVCNAPLSTAPDGSPPRAGAARTSA